MEKVTKKSFAQVVSSLKVKELIKNAKTKKNIKPHTQAFKENPTQIEKHQGNIDYYKK